MVLGYSTEEALHLCPQDLITEDDTIEQKRIIESLLKGGKRSDCLEFHAKHKDGQIVPIEVRVSFVPSEDGDDPVEVVGIARDITERKKTEEKLHAMSQEWSQTFDITSDAIFTLDRDMKVKQINRKAREIFNCPPETAIGKNCWEIIHGARGPIYNCPDFDNCPSLRAMATALPETQELTKNGRWYRVRIDPIFNEKNEYKGCIHVVTDITELKHAVEQAQKKEEQYKFLAENVADLVFIMDLNLTITYVSSSVESILGYSQQERMNQKFEETVTSDSFHKVQKILEHQLAIDPDPSVDPQRTVIIETEDYHKNGSIVWMENIVKAIRNDEGKITGIYGASRDITDRKKDQLALVEKNCKLEKALAEIKKLSGLLPICSSCKKIRDDRGYWNKIESYIQSRSEAQFTHSLCPECMEKLYGKEEWFENPEDKNK